MKKSSSLKVKRETIAMITVIAIGLIIIMFLSNVIENNCSVKATYGCETNSSINNSLILVGKIIYFVTIILIPIAVLATTLYALLVMQRLRQK